jgi:hypothetical protein
VNRIPDAIRGRIVQLALDEPELSPRELATRFTDTANYFVSEASVYRLFKAHEQSNGGRRVLRAGSNNPAGKRMDQTKHNPKTTLAAPKESRVN